MGEWRDQWYHIDRDKSILLDNMGKDVFEEHLEEVVSEESLQAISRSAERKLLLIEFWVGLFFVISLVCLGYLCINLGKMRLFETDKQIIKAEFDNISGLKLGAPVELAGVPIGEIAALELQNTSAIVTMRISQGYKLRLDDIAAVRTKGIIGDRYIKIIPGGSDSFVPNGGQITDTESTVELEDLVGKFIHKME